MPRFEQHVDRLPVAAPDLGGNEEQYVLDAVRNINSPLLIGTNVVPGSDTLAADNIAGAVVIDFVTMRSTYDRDKVQAALAEALAEDPVPTQLYGFTRLGHFELTRARRGATLAAQLEALERPGD